jgi:hypothetical protein
VTAGTVVDRMRSALTVWFTACWLFAIFITAEYRRGLIRLTLTAPAHPAGRGDDGRAGQATTGLRHLPIRPWAGLGVLADWSAAALLAGALLLRPRDA